MGPMLGFDNTSCDTADALCKTVFGWTDNQKLANASDIVIGKPLALLWLLVLFLIAAVTLVLLGVGLSLR